MAAIVQTPLSSRSRYLWVDRERGRFLVHRSAYTSPEIFEEERRRILHRSWIVLAHESEVPNKGDFVVRQVVDRELIFNRDVDGKVNAFFNSCRHRGSGDMPRAARQPHALRLPLSRLGLQEFRRAVQPALDFRLRRAVQRGRFLRSDARGTTRQTWGLLFRQFRPKRDLAR